VVTKTTDPILNHASAVINLELYFSNICFNIILLSIPRSDDSFIEPKRGRKKYSKLNENKV
jgi:hypothetical protein